MNLTLTKHPRIHAQMKRVERLDEEAWQGVAQVDRGAEPPDWR